MSKALLYTSIVGSKLAEKLPRYAVVENEMAKHVWPPRPFIPKLLGIDPVKEITAEASANNWTMPAPNVEGQFFPLSIRRNVPNEPWYTLPYEPLITIGGKNTIVKRSPVKNRNLIGTIKEYFAQADYSITITGAIMGQQMVGGVEETFPRADFQKLKDYCTSPEGLQVKCEPLQLLGINYIAVEDFDFPFTKGENVQAYEIKAISDFAVDFLLEIEE